MKGLNYNLVRVVYKLGVLGLTFGVELSEGMEALGVGEVTFLIGNNGRLGRFSGCGSL